MSGQPQGSDKEKNAVALTDDEKMVRDLLIFIGPDLPQLKNFFGKIPLQQIHNVIDKLSQNENAFLSLFGNINFWMDLPQFLQSSHTNAEKNFNAAMWRVFTHISKNPRYFKHIFPNVETLVTLTQKAKNSNGSFESWALEGTTETIENFKHIFKEACDVTYILQEGRFTDYASNWFIISIMRKPVYFRHLFETDEALHLFLGSGISSQAAKKFSSCVIAHAPSFERNLNISLPPNEQALIKRVFMAVDLLAPQKQPKESKEVGVPKDQLIDGSWSSVPKPQSVADEALDIEAESKSTKNSTDEHYKTLLKQIGPNLERLIKEGESPQTAYERHKEIIDSFTFIESIEKLTEILTTAPPYYLSKIISAKNFILLFTDELDSGKFFQSRQQHINTLMPYLLAEPDYFQYMISSDQDLIALIEGVHPPETIQTSMASQEQTKPVAYDYAKNVLKHILNNKHLLRHAFGSPLNAHKFLKKMNRWWDRDNPYVPYAHMLMAYLVENPEEFKKSFTDPCSTIELLKEFPSDFKLIRSQSIQSEKDYFKSLFKDRSIRELISFLKQSLATNTAESHLFKKLAIEATLEDAQIFNSLVITNEDLNKLLNFLPKEYRRRAQDLFALKYPEISGGTPVANLPEVKDVGPPSSAPARLSIGGAPKSVLNDDPLNKASTTPSKEEIMKEQFINALESCKRYYESEPDAKPSASDAKPSGSILSFFGFSKIGKPKEEPRKEPRERIAYICDIAIATLKKDGQKVDEIPGILIGAVKLVQVARIRAGEYDISVKREKLISTTFTTNAYIKIKPGFFEEQLNRVAQQQNPPIPLLIQQSGDKGYICHLGETPVPSLTADEIIQKCIHPEIFHYAKSTVLYDALQGLLLPSLTGIVDEYYDSFAITK
jgi:hypothetical protein